MRMVDGGRYIVPYSPISHNIITSDRWSEYNWLSYYNGTCHCGRDTLGSKWTFCPWSWRVGSRINGQSWGSEWLWGGSYCDGSLTVAEHVQNSLSFRRSWSAVVSSHQEWETGSQVLKVRDVRWGRRVACVVRSHKRAIVHKLMQVATMLWPNSVHREWKQKCDWHE